MSARYCESDPGYGRNLPIAALHAAIQSAQGKFRKRNNPVTILLDNPGMARMVRCVKLWRQAEGLEGIPYPVKLGQMPPGYVPLKKQG